MQDSEISLAKFQEFDVATQNALVKPVSTQTAVDKSLINEANKEFATWAEITHVTAGTVLDGQVELTHNYSNAFSDTNQMSAISKLGEMFSGNANTVLDMFGLGTADKGSVAAQSAIMAAEHAMPSQTSALEAIRLALDNGIDRINLSPDGGYTSANKNTYGQNNAGQPYYVDNSGYAHFVGLAGMSYADAMAELREHLVPGGVDYRGDSFGGGGAIGNAGSSMNDFMSGAMDSGSSYQDALNDWAAAD